MISNIGFFNLYIQDAKRYFLDENTQLPGRCGLEGSNALVKRSREENDSGYYKITMNRY